MLLERLRAKFSGEVHTRPCEVFEKVILDLLRFWAAMRLALDPQNPRGVSQNPIIWRGWGQKILNMTPLWFARSPKQGRAIRHTAERLTKLATRQGASDQTQLERCPPAGQSSAIFLS